MNKKKSQGYISFSEEAEKQMLDAIEQLETKLFVKTALIDKITEKTKFYSSLSVETEYDRGFNKAFEIIKALLGVAQ